MLAADGFTTFLELLGSAEALAEVNRALASLTGRRLRSVHAAMRLPGRYALVLEMEGLHLTLGIGPEGLCVESLSAG